MNPSNSNPHPIQDVHVPSSNPANPTEAKVEHSIPVKLQKQSAQNEYANPIASTKQFIEQDNDHTDAELDHILADVNKKVQEPDGKTKFKQKFSLKKKLSNKNTKPVANKPKNAKPYKEVLVTLVVAGALSVAAFYAYKPAKNTSTNKIAASVAGKVGTSSASSDAVQAAGGKLVQPGDLSDLSSALQTKISTLNDTQDFDQTPLSDQSLGL